MGRKIKKIEKRILRGRKKKSWERASCGPQAASFFYTCATEVSQRADCLDAGLSPKEGVLDELSEGARVVLLIGAQPEDDLWHKALQARRQRPLAFVECHHVGILGPLQQIDDVEAVQAMDHLVTVAVRPDEAKQTVRRHGVHFRADTARAAGLPRPRHMWCESMQRVR